MVVRKARLKALTLAGVKDGKMVMAMAVELDE